MKRGATDFFALHIIELYQKSVLYSLFIIHFLHSLGTPGYLEPLIYRLIQPMKPMKYGGFTLYKVSKSQKSLACTPLHYSLGTVFQISLGIVFQISLGAVFQISPGISSSDISTTHPSSSLSSSNPYISMIQVAFWLGLHKFSL